MNISNIIIIIILILVVAWGLNNIFFKTNIIYDQICNAAVLPDMESLTVDNIFDAKTNIIRNKDIDENNTSNFMLSVWFYIDNWGNNISQEKNILYFAPTYNSVTADGLSTSLSGISKKVSLNSALTDFKNVNICLDKFENNLFIDIETYPENVSDSKSNFTRYKISNIAVQKWNCLTLSIDTRTLDVYLDGKLVNSFILHGLYKNKNENNKKKNIYLGNIGGTNIGFEGFITRIRYEPTSINPQEAYNIYKEGINDSLAKSMFNKYKLKVSFMEYEKVKGSFTI